METLHFNQTDLLINMIIPIFLFTTANYNYSVNDHRWVRENIIGFLEDHKYKLCLHTRDFVPTATIQRNINLSIKHSRRMISVVNRYEI